MKINVQRERLKYSLLYSGFAQKCIYFIIEGRHREEMPETQNFKMSGTKNHSPT